MKITEEMIQVLFYHLNQRLETDFPGWNFRVKKICVRHGNEKIQIKQ